MGRSNNVICSLLVDHKQLKSTTIQSYLSAIRAVLFLLSSLMRACKLKLFTHLPIQKELLNLIIDECYRYFNKQKKQPYLTCLYNALMLSAYYGLLRVGEVTKGPHVILAKNVHILPRHTCRG